MENKRQLKLTIELVPATSWRKSLKRTMSKKKWKKLREQIFAEYDWKCSICGSSGKLNCHEVWEYDDINHKQRLKALVPLCDLCHHVRHIGMAAILASEGKLDMEEVIQHFMKVNECDRETFINHKRQAFEQWERRSAYEWEIDFGEYKDFIRHL